MIYKAFIKQEGGEGCDSTIACGETIIDLEATTLEEAKIELIKEIKENFSDDERRLEIAELYEIIQVQVIDIDLERLYNEIDEAEIEEDEKQVEEEEREQYKKLKAKYEK